MLNAVEQILGEVLNFRISNLFRCTWVKIPMGFLASWGFAFFFSEVQSKSLPDGERREWLAIPETIVSYVSEAVNKVTPKVSQFVLDAVQSPTVTAARYGKLLCTNTPMGKSEKGEGGVGERIDYLTIYMGRSRGKLIRNQRLMYQESEVLEGGVR